MRARKGTNRKTADIRLEDILVHRGESLPERTVNKKLVEDRQEDEPSQSEAGASARFTNRPLEMMLCNALLALVILFR